MSKNFFSDVVKGDTLIPGQNGALQYRHITSHDEAKNLALELFGGVNRGDPMDEKLALLDELPADSMYYILLAMFHLRSIEDGKGERMLFYKVFMILFGKCPVTAMTLLKHIVLSPHGYLNDLNNLYILHILDPTVPINHQLRTFIVDMWVNIVEDEMGNALVHKWIPREGSKYNSLALALSLRLWTSGISKPLLKVKNPKDKYAHKKAYRRLIQVLAPKGKPTIERLLCDIGQGHVSEDDVKSRCGTDFGWLPSIATTKSRRAIKNVTKDGSERHHKTCSSLDLRPLVASYWDAHMKRVATGKSEIKAGAIDHKMMASEFYGLRQPDPVLEAQMTSILGIIGGTSVLSSTVSVLDVSASMEGVPLMMCLYLGYFVTQLSDGVWKNRAITFHTIPSWITVTGDSHKARMDSIRRADWGGSTNFLLTLRLILNLAKEHGLPQSALPKTLFIFSDMQFNSADSRFGGTTYQIAAKEWRDAGYVLPMIVFWNLASRTTGFAVNGDTPNTVLLSGFSPVLLKMFLSGHPIFKIKDPTPMDVMMLDFWGDSYKPVRELISKVQTDLHASGKKPELIIPSDDDDPYGKLGDSDDDDSDGGLDDDDV